MMLKFDKIKKVGTNKLAIDISEHSHFLDDATSETLGKIDKLVMKLVGTLNRDDVIAAHMMIDGMTHIYLEVMHKTRDDAEELERIDKENGINPDMSPNRLRIIDKRRIERELSEFGEQLLVCYNLLVAWMEYNIPKYSYDPLWEDFGIPESIDLDYLRDHIEQKELHG